MTSPESTTSGSTEPGSAQSGSAKFPLGRRREAPPPPLQTAKKNLGAPRPATPNPPPTPKGWYSRGYLPHFDEINLFQSITIRLADSLPQSKLHQLDEELATLPEDKRALHRRIEIENHLDAGLGCCALRHPAVAETVQNALFHADGTRYRLLAWCIMPNHLHVLIRPLVSLTTIVQAWKGFTGNWAMSHNAELNLRIPGPRFWQREMWDRYIRDWTHLGKTITYIHENPVKARLCATPESWPWSSAAHATVTDIAAKHLPNIYIPEDAPSASAESASAKSGSAKFPLGRRREAPPPPPHPAKKNLGAPRHTAPDSPPGNAKFPLGA